MHASFHSRLNGSSSDALTGTANAAAGDWLKNEIREANELLILALVNTVGEFKDLQAPRRANVELQAFVGQICRVTQRLSGALNKMRAMEPGDEGHGLTPDRVSLPGSAPQLSLRHPMETERRLTRREGEVLQLLAAGRSNKEVASVLGISSKTAETHRARVMKKLHLHSISALIRYAISNRIVDL